MNSLIHLKKSRALWAALAVTTVLCAAPSRASLTGTIWENDGDSGDASKVPPNTKPNAQFASPTINYHVSNSDAQSINTFLNNPSFFNPQNGFDGSHLADNTFIQLTGTIFLHAGINSFEADHDDGVVLTLPGLSATPLVNEPGPTGEVPSFFSVTAPADGQYDMILNYAECCGGPAALVMKLNNEPVPIGDQVPDATSTLPLLGLASGWMLMFSRHLKHR